MIALLLKGIHLKPVQWLMCSTLRLCRILAGSDRRFMGLVHKVMAGSAPEASCALKHYVDGSGEPLAVSFGSLFQRDDGFRAHVARSIRNALRDGRRGGSIEVPQWQLSDCDARMTLGSFQLAWSSADQNINAQIRGTYDWHPNEARITRVIHEAASRLKTAGAKSFAFQSNVERHSLDSLMSRADFDRIPRDRLYM